MARDGYSVLDALTGSGVDDPVFQAEAADDAPGELPELVVGAPQRPEGLQFGAQAFLAVADAYVDHVVGRVLRGLRLLGVQADSATMSSTVV